MRFLTSRRLAALLAVVAILATTALLAFPSRPTAPADGSSETPLPERLVVEHVEGYTTRDVADVTAGRSVQGVALVNLAGAFDKRLRLNLGDTAVTAPITALGADTHHRTEWKQFRLAGQAFVGSHLREDLPNTFGHGWVTRDVRDDKVVWAQAKLPDGTWAAAAAQSVHDVVDPREDEESPVAGFMATAACLSRAQGAPVNLPADARVLRLLGPQSMGASLSQAVTVIGDRLQPIERRYVGRCALADQGPRVSVRLAADVVGLGPDGEVRLDRGQYDAWLGELGAGRLAYALVVVGGSREPAEAIFVVTDDIRVTR